MAQASCSGDLKFQVHDPLAAVTSVAMAGRPFGGMDVNIQGNNEWPTDFIIRDVFFKLSQDLGHEWQNFIRFLPGWSSSTRATAVIQQSQGEEHSVQNQVLKCLITWSQECADHVRKQNIFAALQNVQRNDLVNKLQTLDPNV